MPPAWNMPHKCHMRQYRRFISMHVYAELHGWWQELYVVQRYESWYHKCIKCFSDDCQRSQPEHSTHRFPVLGESITPWSVLRTRGLVLDVYNVIPSSKNLPSYVCCKVYPFTFNSYSTDTTESLLPCKTFTIFLIYRHWQERVYREVAWTFAP